MGNPGLKAAILVISDTASEAPSTDKAISTLSEAFEKDNNSQWTISETRIVPDDIPRVQQAVCQWCDGGDSVNLVVTTGGTGFAVKDYTPEAVEPLIHRHAPGLV